ncbi:MAG: TonB-dependent receptor [Bacteroidetes bacterium]|nr:TonB-dependent receptor [Bacteroidota bacterium]
MKFVYWLFCLICPLAAIGQGSVVKGRVTNALNNGPLEGASVQVQGMERGCYTDANGYFAIEGLAPGLWNIEIRFTGFDTYIAYETRTTTIKPTFLEISLQPGVYTLGEIQVNADVSTNTLFEPVSLQKVSWSELQRMPGTALDLSKAMQSYPGVLPKTSFGYNIVVRGGAPSENAYYLDGIKIPSISHFNLQGGSGGAASLINLDFIQGMDMYPGGFPAQYQSGLSVLLDLAQRTGRQDRVGARITLGYSDLGITAEGPLGQKANFIASARTSFSQNITKALGLPILPTYHDVQFKYNHKLTEKDELTVIGLGGFDTYVLNLDAPESDALLYNVGYIPEGDQQQITVGANYKHYFEKSYIQVIASRNQFNNNADKFKENTGLESDRLLKYRSSERESHLRADHHVFGDNLEIQYGAALTHNDIRFDVLAVDVSLGGPDTNILKQSPKYWEYGAYITMSSRYFQNRLGLSIGIRADGTTLHAQMGMLSQLSPRMSINYALSEKTRIKSSIGSYYQLPPEIIIANALNNPPNGEDSYLDYINSPQASLGMEFKGNTTYKASIDAYYKGYAQYPFLVRDQIAFANVMADYVAVGNQSTMPIGEGQAYGLEMFIQQKLKRNYWWMLAYSYNRSEFKDKSGRYRPSSWDSRHFLTLNMGKALKRNWQLGMKWRFSTGTPYTPYNLDLSAIKENWDVANRGVFDYDRLNEARLPSFHQMDIRVDKNWYFKKWNLNLFFDYQNLYSNAIELMPYLTAERDEHWELLEDPKDPNRYLVKQISSDTGRSLYTLGLIAEF